MTTPARVLITGGSTGIGFGLAQRFAAQGSQVVITGRDRTRLQHAADRIAGITTISGDLSKPEDRTALATSLGPIDMLINNAGLQRRIGLAEDTAPWQKRQQELDLLLAAPMHLTDLLLPAMLQNGTPATIVNVTSGGAFTPQPFAPGYSAAKAALHNFTMNLRHALTGTTIRVIEVIPPAVATGLSSLANPHGADTDQFCDATFTGIAKGTEEIGFGPTASPAFAALLHTDRVRFEQAADRFPTPTYRKDQPAT